MSLLRKAPLKTDAPSEGAESLAGSQRRSFLAHLSLLAGGVVASVVAVPFVGAILTPLRKRAPRRWQSIGKVEEFPVGATVQVRYLAGAGLPWAGYSADGAAYVRREDPGRFVAFSAYCTHTGCPIRWHAGSDMFFCPCHGGVFHRDGRVAAGPPPRPLPMLEVRVRGEHVELRSLPMLTTEPTGADPTKATAVSERKGS